MFKSPILKDSIRVVSFDSEGREYIDWVQPDYKALLSYNGSADDWNLQKMVQSGINPKNIHTSGGSRLDNYDTLNEFLSVADSIAKEDLPIDNN